MEHINQINMAISAVSLTFLTVTVFPMFLEINRPARMNHLTAAGVLHAIALLLRVAVQVGLKDRERIFFIVSVVIDAVSMILLLTCIFEDTEGGFRLFGGEKPLSVSLIAAVVIPFTAAVLLENTARGVELLGSAYAVSLCVAQTILEKEHSKALQRREEALDLRYNQMLIEQIRPHFIANVLMSIEELCYTAPETAAVLINDFAGYLRGNLDTLTSDSLIPFDKELSHVRQYAALEQADPERRFTMAYALSVTDFLLPALSVQPIVENAIRHGALSRKDGKGAVRLTTEKRGDYIRIIVEDNGTGEASFTKRQSAHRSVGLQNVKARLEKQCGGTLTMKTSEEGAKVVIRIPVITPGAEKDQGQRE